MKIGLTAQISWKDIWEIYEPHFEDRSCKGALTLSYEQCSPFKYFKQRNGVGIIIFQTLFLNFEKKLLS